MESPSMELAGTKHTARLACRGASVSSPLVAVAGWARSGVLSGEMPRNAELLWVLAALSLF